MYFFRIKMLFFISILSVLLVSPAVQAYSPNIGTSSPINVVQPVELPVTQLIQVQFDDYTILAPQDWSIFKWEKDDDDVDAFVNFRALYRQSFPTIKFSIDPLTIVSYRFAAMLPGGYNNKSTLMVIQHYTRGGVATSAKIDPSEVTASSYLELYYDPANIQTFEVNGLTVASTQTPSRGRTVYMVSYLFSDDVLVANFPAADELFPSLQPLMALMTTSLAQKGQANDVEAWKNLVADMSSLPETIILPAGAANVASCSVSAAKAVTVRSGPGTTFDKQGTLNSGDTRQPIGQTEGSDGMIWFQLSSSEWVRSDVVQQSGDCQTLPQAASS